MHRAEYITPGACPVRLATKRSVESTINQGLEQTAQYMDTCGATEGHLILFDRREGKSWEERIWTKQETAADGKQITIWAM